MPRRRQAVIAVGVMLLIACTALVGWRVIVLQRTAQDAREHLAAAREAMTAAATSPTAEPVSIPAASQRFTSACADISAASNALQDVNAQMDSLMPLVGALENLPGVGGQARSQAATLDAGTQLALAGASLCDGLAPLTTLLTDNGSGSSDGSASDLLQTLVAARPRLIAADSRLEELQRSLAGTNVDDLDAGNRAAIVALRDRLPQAATTLHDAAVVLDLLGAQQPHRFLLISQNPDELRATGGFIGSAGVVSAEHGSVHLVEYGSSRNYDTPPDMRAVPPVEFQGYLGAAYWNLAGANWWPSFPDVARQLAYFYALSRPTEPVDGVVAFDQFGLEQLLGVLGPVEVPEYGEVVSDANVQQEIDHYVHAGDAYDESGRKQFTAALSAAVLQRVLEAPRSALPGLIKVVRACLDEQHLLVWAADPDATALLARKHWDGALLPAPGDALMLVDTDVVASKQSQEVTRDATYTVDLREPSTPLATLSVSYTNAARPEQRPEVHFVPDYRTFLRAYVPDGATLVSTAGFSGAVTSADECGRRVFGGEVSIPEGSSVQVMLTYQLPAARFSSGYDLVVQQQPGVPPGGLTVFVKSGRDITARAALGNQPGRQAHWQLDPSDQANMRMAALPDEQIDGCGFPLVIAKPIAEPASIVAPIADINAQIVDLGVSPDGEMEAPPTPQVAGWYRMSARPGQPGNTVVSGHVDWGRNTAVFWGLRRLKPGDPIQIVDTDGVSHTYAVEWNEVFPANGAPVDRIVGPSSDSVLTLITCDGTFDPRLRQYLDRRVVRARLSN